MQESAYESRPDPPPDQDPDLLFHRTASTDGYRVSGLHGYPEGRLRSTYSNTRLPVYEYYLANDKGQERCLAGLVDDLRCSGKVCTGKFYEVGRRRGAADPDAKVSFHMDDRYKTVSSMTIQHNTSDRYLDALVTQNNNSLKVPTITLPGPERSEADTVTPLCVHAQCNGYRLTHNSELKGFITGVTCDDILCEGDLTLSGGERPSHRIQLSMISNPEARGKACRNPVFENVGCVRLRHNDQSSWSVQSAHCL